MQQQPSSPPREQAMRLDTMMFPHIMDTIWSYAPNDALMRLRCVSRDFKARADALLLDHIVFRDIKCDHELARNGECYDEHCSDVRNVFYSTTGKRLPALYSIPLVKGGRRGWGEVPQLLGRLLAGTRVLDFVQSSGDRHHSLVSFAAFHPAATRSYGLLGVRCPKRAPTHVHIVGPKADSGLQVTILNATRKLVIHFQNNIVGWKQNLGVHSVAHWVSGGPVLTERVALEDVVLIFGSKHASATCNNDAQAAIKGSDDKDAADKLACNRLLRSILGCFYVFEHKYEKKIANITFVDFPFPLLAQSCVPALFRKVFDISHFVDSETYRKQVSEGTWAIQTDSRSFEAMCDSAE